MKYEDLLVIALSVASVIQFFLSFIKGRSGKKGQRNTLLKLSPSNIKRKFLALLLIGLIVYFIYVIITGYFSVLGLMIIIYFLLCIYDFSKCKVILEDGIGQKSLYGNSYYNFTHWEDIVKWEWSKEKENMLLFKINRRNKIEMRDWQVTSFEREKIDNLFRENIKQD